MQFYNKIMLYFWLFGAIASLIGVTIMGFVEGFELWVYYYVVPIICIFMYLFRKWMMTRMEKHLQFLEDQRKEKE